MQDTLIGTTNVAQRRCWEGLLISCLAELGLFSLNQYRWLVFSSLPLSSEEAIVITQELGYYGAVNPFRFINVDKLTAEFFSEEVNIDCTMRMVYEAAVPLQFDQILRCIPTSRLLECIDCDYVPDHVIQDYLISAVRARDVYRLTLIHQHSDLRLTSTKVHRFIIEAPSSLDSADTLFEVLVAGGYDLNSTPVVKSSCNSKQWSALHYYYNCHSLFVDSVALLIKHGVDVNYKNAQHQTASHFVANRVYENLTLGKGDQELSKAEKIIRVLNSAGIDDKHKAKVGHMLLGVHELEKLTAMLLNSTM